MTADSILVLGVDPGPTTGIAALRYTDGRLAEVRVAQCCADWALPLLTGLGLLDPAQRGLIVLAIERFVVGPRAAHSATAVAGQITRDLAGALIALGEPTRVLIRTRSAAEVKPWATDTRLDAAGLLAPTRGSAHARDGCRHALFAACHDLGIPDPLSRHSER